MPAEQCREVVVDSEAGPQRSGFTYLTCPFYKNLSLHYVTGKAVKVPAEKTNVFSVL